MLALYLGTFGFGVVLIVVSLLLGGGGDTDVDSDVELDVDADVDLDIDADVDVDIDADVDVDHGGGDVGLDLDSDTDADGGGVMDWLPVTSMRFWTFALAAFGFVGAALRLGGVHWIVTLALALTVGLALGWGAALFFRALLRDKVTGETEVTGLAGREGQVVLAVRPGSRGKIALLGPSGRLELFAVTRDDRPIERGERILIAHVQDGVADITRLDAPPRARRDTRAPETS